MTLLLFNYTSKETNGAVLRNLQDSQSELPGPHPWEDDDMSLAVSVYLDLFRMAAALVVFLSHTAGSGLTGFLVPEAGSFGSEAVAAFFVLSGFVIGYVADTRENAPGSYAVSRLARVYSVALPAIIITLACDAAGRALQPDLYSPGPIDWQPTTWLNLFCTVFFVNELWNADVQLGTNGPYWSLGFEVWYYVLFGLVVFTRRFRRIAAVVVWLAFVGPRVSLAFPIWLMGCAAYIFSKRRQSAPTFGFVLFCATILIYWPFHLRFGQPFKLQLKLVFGYDTLRGYGYYYTLGALICLNFIGFSLMSRVVSGFAARIAKPVRWLAGATFTFYLMHLPIAVMLCAISPWPPQSTVTRVIVLGGTILLVLVLAEFGERRKTWWRGVFAALLSRQQKIVSEFMAPNNLERENQRGGVDPRRI
jgi:peptidoglycan/LPS O-acetylase OafA/YrhL